MRAVLLFAVITWLQVASPHRTGVIRGAPTIAVHNFITWDDAEDNDFKVRSLKAAVVEIHFGQDLFVNGTRWLESTAVNDLAELKCGSAIFKSTGGDGLGGFHTANTIASNSLLGLYTRSIAGFEASPRAFSGILPLEIGVGTGSEIINDIADESIASCQLSFQARATDCLCDAAGQRILSANESVDLEVVKRTPHVDGGLWDSEWPDTAHENALSALSALQVTDSIENVMDLDMAIEPLIAGMAKPLATAGTAMVGGEVKSVATENLKAQVVTETVNLLLLTTSATIANKVTLNLMEFIAAAFKDQLPLAVSEAVRDYITVVATEEVTARITRAMHDRMGQIIPPKVVHTSKVIVGAKSMLTLGSILGKSISHSLTGALMHATTHNAGMDYYCFLCYKSKLYCDYCSHEPRQLYYTQYYTGFYSAYYADYYSRYFFKTAAFEVDKATEDADTQFKFELERLADDICQHDNCNKLGKDYPLPPN